MKLLYCISLVLLTACSSAPLPKVDLRPQPAPPSVGNSSVRYPEVLHAYNFGRYVDPNDSLVMHEQHMVFRVEETSRWDLHSASVDRGVVAAFPTPDAAFAATPVNDAILGEVNSQRLATAQIMAQSRLIASSAQQLEKTLQSAKSDQETVLRLRVAVDELKRRIATLEAAQSQTPTNAPQTNAPTDINP